MVDALAVLVGESHHSTDSIQTAAAEQSDGIGQVNGAVTQLNQMTQQNTASQADAPGCAMAPASGITSGI